MLIRKPVQERIKAGEVTLAFRRWRRPSVKPGGTLRTAVGLLEIENVEVVDESDISDRDARKAGFPGRDELLDELAGRDGDLYRIQLAYAGDDPRIALREEDALTDEAFADLRKRLDRMDARSPEGAWTGRVLALIEARPECRAADLAAESGWERDRLKTNVRKLKNLGLTVSHEVGYSLSPRGAACLDRLRRERS